jgi:hypothetical protein
VAGGKTAESGERASLGGPAEQDVSSPTSRLIDPQNREGGLRGSVWSSDVLKETGEKNGRTAWLN